MMISFLVDPWIVELFPNVFQRNEITKLIDVETIVRYFLDMQIHKISSEALLKCTINPA